MLILLVDGSHGFIIHTFSRDYCFVFEIVIMCIQISAIAAFTHVPYSDSQ